MARQKIHNRVNIGILIILTGIYYFVPEVREFVSKYGGIRVAGVFAGLYLFSNFYLSPDLDLQSSACLRRWGPFKFVWKPYSWLFGHRKLSHSLLFGTPSRIFYLLTIFLIGLYVLDLISILQFDWRKGLQYKYYFIAGLAGLYIPGVLHTIIDRIS